MSIKDTDVVEDAGPGLVTVTDIDGNTKVVTKFAIWIDDLRFQATQRKLW